MSPRPTPIRSRGNASVPSDAMIDFNPLCPPADPSGLIRSRPSLELHLVDDDEQLLDQLDLVELQQRRPPPRR